MDTVLSVYAIGVSLFALALIMITLLGKSVDFCVLTVITVLLVGTGIGLSYSG